MAAARWIVAGTLLIAILKLRGEPLPAAAPVASADGARRAAPWIRQRRGGLGRADGAERPDGGAGRDVAVLDGRHRCADAWRRTRSRRAASPVCGRLWRDRAAGVARARGWRQRPRAFSPACVRRSSRALAGRSGRRTRDARPRAGEARKRARHGGVRDAVRRHRAPGSGGVASASSAGDVHRRGRSARSSI